MNTAIIVHGGAGAWQPARLSEAAVACREAAAAGQAVLLDGGNALDAVEAAVRVLEDAPILNAGRGSCLNSNGEIEMDALIVDGQTLDLGAVGAVQRILHPISLARRIMTDSKHTFLVAHGAQEFAREIGFPRCKSDELIVPEQWARYEQSKAQATDRSLGAPVEERTMDTVGAVALDRNGNLAAGTSTGGVRNKKPGRIGDSPLIGSGAYADNRIAAASATGEGEALMKIVICKRACDFIAGGMSARAACQAAIDILTERVHGEGGIIAIDTQANVGWAYNTTAMPYAFVRGDGTVENGQ